MARSSLVLRRPDDWHLHLRDGGFLRHTVPATASVFGRALVMPNLKPPVTNVSLARAYRERILAAREPGSSFDPKLALYLTPETTVDDVREAAAEPSVLAFKLYPHGATTNSASGLHDLHTCAPIFAALEAHDLVLCVHGETTDPTHDVFDREGHFLDGPLSWLVSTFPRLRIVLEHITTTAAVDFVRAHAPRVAATITAHHLLYDRNAMFDGGLRPHLYCLPVLKRRRDREALLKAATSGEPCFFLGTDSAPHPRTAKESACGCAGIYTAPHALALYAEAFDQENRLDRLDDFASRFGAEFYRLTLPTTTVTLERIPAAVPQSYVFGTPSSEPRVAAPSLPPMQTEPPVEVVPLRAGSTVAWSVRP